MNLSISGIFLAILFLLPLTHAGNLRYAIPEPHHGNVYAARFTLVGGLGEN